MRSSVFNFRYVDGAKAASAILQQDQRHVGALFLRYDDVIYNIKSQFLLLHAGASACTTRTMLRELSHISSRFTPTYLDLNPYATNFRFYNSRKDMSERKLYFTRRDSSRRKRRQL